MRDGLRRGGACAILIAMRFREIPWTIALLVLPALLSAAPLSRDDAVRHAREWMARGEAGRPPRRGAVRPHGAPTGRVRTCAADGADLFHLVALEGGGFVAVAADDARQPVLGFSASGELPDPDPANPFWTLVGADAEAAAGGERRRGVRRSPRAYAVRDEAASASGPNRATLASASIASISGIDDVRVPPLVQSKWDQENVGSKNVYNYYTPNNWVCGCVATALAQLMRFHQFPRAPVTAQTFTCHVNDVATQLTMKGGSYDWNSMPLVPSSGISDVGREAIGRICHDAGVAMRMWYGPSGSASYTMFAIDPLKQVFGFSSAHSTSDYYTSLNDMLYKGILPNLDAGFPVVLGLSGSSVGHAILADGYGYASGVLYCHLNMGWSGAYDYWYALPDVRNYYTFTAVSDLVYNIFPDRTGELVTGRVTDPFGEPVAGASVTASGRYLRGARYRTFTTNVTTSATGHYAVFAPAGTSANVTLSATSGEWISTNAASAATTASTSPINFDFDEGYFSTAQSSLTIGNSWGNDLFLAPASVAAPVFTAFSAARNEGGAEGFAASFTGTAGAPYRLEWSASLVNPQWNMSTNILMPRGGVADIFLSAPTGAGAAFFRAVGGR